MFVLLYSVQQIKNVDHIQYSPSILTIGQILSNQFNTQAVPEISRLFHASNLITFHSADETSFIQKLDLSLLPLQYILYFAC